MTREAILASVRRLLSVRGCDGAGVREIAGGAGVTAMLVNRYFGSKEKTVRLVSETMTTGAILTRKVTLLHPRRNLAAAIIDQTRVDAKPSRRFRDYAPLCVQQPRRGNLARAG